MNLIDIYTPFFGIFGEDPHFNNIKEALGCAERYINSIEPGLISDPLLLIKNFYLG